MTFTAFVCSTRTGRNYGPLDCKISSWARVLNGSDTSSVQLFPGALTPATRDEYRQSTTPGLMSLVIDWDGIPLVAGPIWNRPLQGDAVTINASGIRNLLVRRKAHTWATPLAGQALTYADMSLGSIAAELVRVATSSTKPGAELPIVLPNVEIDTDAGHTRTYAGFDLKSVSDLLNDITGVQDGPDIDFRPEWVDSNRSAIRWRMLVGSNEQPLLISQNQLAFDYAAPRSGVRQVDSTEDASQMATAQWAKGAGSDTSTLMSLAVDTTYTDLGFPLLENETDYTTVSDQGTLDTHAAGDQAAFAQPTEQYDVTVDALDDPPLGSYGLGDVATIRVQDHFWLPDSPPAGYPVRILGYSGNGTTTVKLAVQDAALRGLDVLGTADQQLASRVARLERQSG